MTHRDTVKTVVINGLRYPLGDVVQRSQLAFFIRKFTVGDAQYDSDDYQSALILANFSGGIGIEDSDEGADTTRFWFGVADTRSPRMISLPPLVTQTQPSGVTGTTVRPLGVIGTQFYCAFGTNVYGWKDSTDTWHSTSNAFTYAPVNKPVVWDGNIWVPQGANGVTYCSTTESNASNGTLAARTNVANPKAAALAIWNNKLYALTTEGYLYALPQGTTTWTQIADSGGTNVRLNTGETPKNLVTYFDRTGNPVLWAITDRSAYMYYDSAREWRRSNIQFPPHPDFGRSATVWRTGEDLWISAASDIVRQTSGNAIVPMASGLSRDQGLPQEYRGSIIDLEPEISNLYALVGNSSTPTSPYTYAATVGTSGTGDGQFDDPRGIAVDSSGNVWVCDENNERIQVFNSSLVFQAKTGSAGSGDGQYASNSGPIDLAFDASGNLWVTDYGNARVQKYTVSGTTATYSSQFGSSGTGDGQFSGPAGIDINTTSGRIYVADSLNNRIQYFTSSGTYEGKWGSFGSDYSKFQTPLGVAVNQTTGHVFVADSGMNRVQEFTATGTFVRAWGSGAAGPGRLITPTGIAIHPTTQNVIVASTGEGAVWEFTATGAFVRRVGLPGSGSTNGQIGTPFGVAFNAAGTSFFASDMNVEDVQKFTYSTSAAIPAYPTLHAWPGTGWHCLWAGDSNTAVPTWAMVSAPTTHYRLWWGMDDGYAYYAKLYRGFENVNQARLAGSATFASSGFVLSSKFDAGMLGFSKLASHVVAIPVQDAISANETVLIEFSIDEGGWETLGTVSSSTLDPDTNEARFSFGAAGRKFNTIRFRLSLARGSTTSLSPMLRSLTLLFNKIPQAARSFIFVITPSSKGTGQFGNRTAQVMFNELDDLAVADSFFDITYNGQTFTHCRLASVTGVDGIAENSGSRTLSIVELPTGA